MIASQLTLSRADVKALKITDPYSLHRVVYDLFDDVRSQADKDASQSSGILYADKGGNFQHRILLLLSDRKPRQPRYGELEVRPMPTAFLQAEKYRFEVTLNPTQRDKATGKTRPVKGRQALLDWFLASAPRWGFEASPEHLSINALAVREFTKKNHPVTLNSATFQGLLRVTGREAFIQSFQSGIGRAKTFGFGLLQLVPLV